VRINILDEGYPLHSKLKHIIRVLYKGINEQKHKMRIRLELSVQICKKMKLTLKKTISPKKP
jgi:hypothetical protein